jgi:hypothetical protein
VKKGFLLFTFIILIFYCAPKKVVKEIASPMETPEKEAYYLWAYKPAVNVRERANAVSAKIEQLTDGDSVVVLNNENGWYQIELASGNKGYIRSDFLAPKEHSIFLRALHFIDNLREKRGIEVFFDKQEQHKQIYISYPEEFYKSDSAVARTTKQLVDSYQKSVYTGNVTALVLKSDSKEIYQRYDFTGITNADVLLPVLPFGLLNAVNIELPDKITLLIKIPDAIEDRSFISASRKMSACYPSSYTHVEIRFHSDNGICRFWYLEDALGEQYHYNHCP